MKLFKFILQFYYVSFLPSHRYFFVYSYWLFRSVSAGDDGGWALL